MKLFAGSCPGKPDAVFIFLFQDGKELKGLAKEIERQSRGGLSRVLKSGFKAGRRDCELLVLPEGKSGFAVLLGLGKSEQFSAEVLREAVAAGWKRISRYRVKRIEIELPPPEQSGLSWEEAARAVGEVCWLANYKYCEFKKAEKKRDYEVWLLGPREKLAKALNSATVVGEEHGHARDLINRPGFNLYPESFAQEARIAARKFGLKLKVYDERALARMGYNGLLMVGRGSRRPPRLLELRYNGAGKDRPLIALIGKGVTFDTGGISLKTPQGMEQMKGDMTGAAVVLSAMKSAARLKLKLNLAGVIPLAENMPGGGAQRPGDIIRYADGTTVEVMSTDAEGRLILADGLYHAQKLGAGQMLDVATLTGAAKIVLGRFAICLMGNDEGLLAKVSEAGAKSGERCWILPTWDDYLDLIKSEVADLKNGHWGREAGTIVGGVFLKKFVKAVPWAHLDIAGTDWSEDAHPYLGRGPTGKGLRLLVRYLEDLGKGA